MGELTALPIPPSWEGCQLASSPGPVFISCGERKTCFSPPQHIKTGPGDEARCQHVVQGCGRGVPLPHPPRGGPPTTCHTPTRAPLLNPGFRRWSCKFGGRLCDDQVQDEIQEGRYQFLALSFHNHLMNLR